MIKANLYDHQIKARDFIVSNAGRGALFMDLGCGKSLTTLAAFDKLQAKRMLVICPLSIIENAWGNDIAKFTDFKFCNARNGIEEADIYAVNYEAILGKKFPALLDKLHPDMLVLDESVRIKSNSALTTKTILKYAPYCKYRVILSGCPAPNNMMEYWAQMAFIDSQIFSPSFYSFRNTYFHLERGSQIIPAGAFITRDKYREIFGKGFKYGITEKNREAMMRRMKPFAMWIKKEDCLQLPDQIDVVRSVILSDEESKHYRQMERHLVTVIEREMVAATNALAKLTKLREITSGFLIDYEGKTLGFGTSKIRELEAVLEELGNRQAIIWVNFHHEVDAVVKRLGIDACAQVHGMVKDKLSEIKDFTSGKKRYLVANPASASSGLNLQNCDTQIFFSLSYSYDDYYQCRGRTHRSGQKNNCTYIHLVAKDTIDEVIVDVLRKKGDQQEIVHRFLKTKEEK